MIIKYILKFFVLVSTIRQQRVKMDSREVGCDPRYWIALAEDKDQGRAYVRAEMNLWVP